MPFLEFARALREHSDAVPLLLRAVALATAYDPEAEAKLRAIYFREKCAAADASKADQSQRERERDGIRRAFCDAPMVLKDALALLLGNPPPLALAFRATKHEPPPSLLRAGSIAGQLHQELQKEDEGLKKSAEKGAGKGGKSGGKGKGGGSGGGGGGGAAASEAAEVAPPPQEGGGLVLAGSALRAWADILLPLSGAPEPGLRHGLGAALPLPPEDPFFCLPCWWSEPLVDAAAAILEEDDRARLEPRRLAEAAARREAAATALRALLSLRACDADTLAAVSACRDVTAFRKNADLRTECFPRPLLAAAVAAVEAGAVTAAAAPQLALLELLLPLGARCAPKEFDPTDLFWLANVLLGLALGVPCAASGFIVAGDAAPEPAWDSAVEDGPRLSGEREDGVRAALLGALGGGCGGAAPADVDSLLGASWLAQLGAEWEAAAGGGGGGGGAGAFCSARADLLARGPPPLRACSPFEGPLRRILARFLCLLMPLEEGLPPSAAVGAPHWARQLLLGARVLCAWEQWLGDDFGGAGVLDLAGLGFYIFHSIVVKMLPRDDGGGGGGGGGGKDGGGGGGKDGGGGGGKDGGGGGDDGKDGGGGSGGGGGGGGFDAAAEARCVAASWALPQPSLLAAARFSTAVSLLVSQAIDDLLFFKALALDCVARRRLLAKLFSVLDCPGERDASGPLFTSAWQAFRVLVLLPLRGGEPAAGEARRALQGYRPSERDITAAEQCAGGASFYAARSLYSSAYPLDHPTWFVEHAMSADPMSAPLLLNARAAQLLASQSPQWGRTLDPSWAAKFLARASTIQRRIGGSARWLPAHDRAPLARERAVLLQDCLERSNTAAMASAAMWSATKDASRLPAMSADLHFFLPFLITWVTE